MKTFMAMILLSFSLASFADLECEEKVDAYLGADNSPSQIHYNDLFKQAERAFDQNDAVLYGELVKKLNRISKAEIELMRATCD